LLIYNCSNVYTKGEGSEEYKNILAFNYYKKDIKRWHSDRRNKDTVRGRSKRLGKVNETVPYCGDVQIKL